MKTLNIKSFLAIIFSFVLFGCKTDNGKTEDFTVNIHVRNNVDNLNTILARNAVSSEILDHNVHRA